VDAFRPDSARHDGVRHWLTDRLRGPEYLLVSDVTAVAFLRITTNRRLWVDPAPIDEAQEFVTVLLRNSRVRLHHATTRQWRIFNEITRDLGLNGNDVPDAYLAASAIDADAVLVTGDRGFRRFPRLRVMDPITQP
ncbi:MAG: TA system VapC family ribonuclease toxin, partial [Actinomycetales bacterium]